MLDHIDSKATDEPINKTAQINELNAPPNPELPLENYFARQKNIQAKLKYTDEPQSDIVLKRLALTELLKMTHMQDAVREWQKDHDKDGKKSFHELRKHMLEAHRIAHHNKQALGSIGIANSVENIKPEVDQLKNDITFVKEAITETINCVAELKQANLASHSNATTTEGTDKAEEMGRKILAAITNTQTESKKKFRTKAN